MSSIAEDSALKLDWLLMADGMVGLIGGRAVTLATGARYCFREDTSGGEAGVVPRACKDLRSEGTSRPVPEIGCESTGSQ